MANVKSLLEGLSDEDKAALHSMSKEALQVEAQRLVLLQARQEWDQGRVPGQRQPGRRLALDPELLKEARIADSLGAHSRVDRELASKTRDRPELAAALQEIRVLARDPKDPAKAEELRAVLADLNEAAARDSRAREMRARSVDPDSEETAWAKRDRKQAEFEGMARSHAVDPPQMVNEIEHLGLSAAKPDPRVVPEDVASNYTRDAKGFHPKHRPQDIAFVDYGTRLQTNRSFDGPVVQDMVSIAAARGWDSMKVTGTEAFRRAVWLEAASRGIAVVGYKPTEAERETAKLAAERNGHMNRIEANPAVRAFTEARTGEERLAAAKAHPELVNAFAQQELLRRFADARMPQAAREAFMAHQTAHLARDVAAGVEIPPVEMRERRQRDRAREAAQER